MYQTARHVRPVSVKRRKSAIPKITALSSTGQADQDLCHRTYPMNDFGPYRWVDEELRRLQFPIEVPLPLGIAALRRTVVIQVKEAARLGLYPKMDTAHTPGSTLGGTCHA